MDRRKLLKILNNEANLKGFELRKVREGGNHTIYEIGAIRVPIPMHRELNKNLVLQLVKELEPILGNEWINK